MVPALSELADVLLTGSCSTTTAVAWVDTFPRGTLLTHRLDDAPHRLLLGFEAPAEWQVFGLLAPARVADRDPLTVVHLVDRSGRDLTRTTGDHRPLAAAAGWVPDLCRRVLGVPTPPATEPTSVLLAHLWLDRLLTVLIAHGHRPPLDWSNCRRVLFSPTGPVVDDAVLAAFGRAFARRHPWPIVRRLTIDDPGFGLDAAQARWFDDGSFARWVLAGFADLEAVRRDVAGLLEPPVAARLDEVLDAWPGVGAAADRTRR